MIYLANINHEITQKYINSFSENPFATRVKGLLKAYGDYPNLYNFWFQNDEKNENNITAYIIRYGGEFIVDLSLNLNFEQFNEIIDMCKMAGGTCIMCRKTDFCDITNSETGIVMKLDRLKINNKLNKFIFTEDVNLTDYYKTLQENNSDKFTVPNFEDFYVDLHHRLRKQSAKILGLYDNSKLISCCTATAVHNSSAVLAGVATLPDYKGQGYGTAVVTEMCYRLINKDIINIFLQRNSNENYSFYNKIGFEDISEFQQINLQY